MTVLYKSNRLDAGRQRPGACIRPAPAPALYRLLADSALSRAALDACGFGIVLLDAQGPVMALSYANRAVERMTGKRADLLVGLPAADALFVEPDALLLEVLARQAEATRAPASARAQLSSLRDRSGSVEVDIALNAVRDVGGALSSWVLSLHEARTC